MSPKRRRVQTEILIRHKDCLSCPLPWNAIQEGAKADERCRSANLIRSVRKIVSAYPHPASQSGQEPFWARCIVTITYWAWGLLRTPMPVMRSFAIARRSEPRSAPPSWGTPHPGTRSPLRRYRPISAANGRLELPLGRRSAVDIKSSEEERRDDKGDTHDTANYRSLHRI